MEGHVTILGNDLMSLHPNELAGMLRSHLPASDEGGNQLLDALLAKAARQDGVCAVCWEAAVQEGKRAALQEKE